MIVALIAEYLLDKIERLQAWRRCHHHKQMRYLYGIPRVRSDG